MVHERVDVGIDGRSERGEIVAAFERGQDAALLVEHDAPFRQIEVERLDGGAIWVDGELVGYARTKDQFQLEPQLRQSGRTMPSTRTPLLVRKPTSMPRESLPSSRYAV